MIAGHDAVEGMARIARLREEIRRVIEREYALAGRYCELAASFEALMPDPNLRHDAVLAALSATLKLEPREVGRVFAGQQEELALLEQAVGELFAELGAGSSRVPGSGQGDSAAGEAPAPRGAASPGHCPKCGEPLTLDRYENRWKCRSCSHEIAPGNTAGGQEREKPATAAAETELQKKCPMCGGVMHYHAHEDRWLCYTCAHEGVPAESGQAGSGGKGGHAKTPVTASAPLSVEPLADTIAGDPRKPAQGGAWTPNRTAVKKKTCPACLKKMDWHEHEKAWRCFFCNHKARY